MTEIVTYHLNEGVATITLDDGKVNALSIDMLNELHEMFDRAASDEAVVVLTGREKYFSAGFDLKVFTETPERLTEMIGLGATLCEKVLAFPTPVITACTGHALAAGTFIPMCADYRIGLDGDFKYGLNEVKIGLTMPLFVQEIARQRLTPAELSRATITARSYSPSEAVGAGFLDCAVSADGFESAIAVAVEELKGLNPAAHAATKLRVRADAIVAVREAIETELAT
ncbi:MAG: crotonase/enoyl-CoA hydratase family protein [Solirubrobacterales bacterium]|nr:crotonase/enoyl-CoA hydratase family protein [Solirubrobacterales bacterium]